MTNSNFSLVFLENVESVNFLVVKCRLLHPDHPGTVHDMEEGKRHATEQEPKEPRSGKTKDTNSWHKFGHVFIN
jgi:hypothetical protein